uniref:Formin-like protein n=1 Tax=Gossypium raimondii TaxID=29730 RepID=A0A0D2QL10_GOSRA|nr:hypothetical protein B456_009G224000 [Gossypium raimondii]
MDPCPFVRLTVGNLALKIPVASKPARSVVHPSLSPCFCKIKLKNFPLQTAVVPYFPRENQFPDNQQQTLAATFHLSKADIDKLAQKSIFSAKPCLKIAVYTGRRGSTCGVNSGCLLGKVSVPLDLAGTESKACVFHNGWISVGKETKKDSSARFHLNVKAEPDPRFVFQFDGEPECSPQVFQIRGNIRQPVFTCKFSFRNTGDRNQGSGSLRSEPSSSRRWLSSFGSERERLGKERKGGTWKPWGRLEAWRERGSSDGLGYRFELIPDMSAAAIVLAESTLSSSKGGKFVIDLGGRSGSNGRVTPRSATSPACSPRSSGDFRYGLWPFAVHQGFVMSAGVEGEGKCSKPRVEVSVQHVNCTEDAAAYVALAAAVDLSIDACRLFSQRLRKELCNHHQELLG